MDSKKNIQTSLHVLVPPFIVLFIHYSLIFLYEIFPAFDILTHFLGGVAIGYGASYVYGIYSPQMPRWLRIISVIGLVVLAATLWEFYEFTMDRLGDIPFRQPSIADTMGDFLNGILGGLLVALFYRKK